MFGIIKDNLFWWILIFLAVVSPSFLFGAFQLVFAVILAVVVIVAIGLLVLRWKVSKIQKSGGGAQYTYRGGGFGSGAAGGSGAGSASGSASANGTPDVKIFVKPTEKRVSEEVGDYVEFEEMDETNETDTKR